MLVEISPFHWNGVEFDVTPAIEDLPALEAWALHWIDPDEQAISDEWGLGNYIHSITAPEYVASKSSFSVDFGSASVESFVSLLNLLIEMGSVEIKIHSNSLLGETKQ